MDQKICFSFLVGPKDEHRNFGQKKQKMFPNKKMDPGELSLDFQSGCQSTTEIRTRERQRETQIRENERQTETERRNLTQR